MAVSFPGSLPQHVSRQLRQKSRDGTGIGDRLAEKQYGRTQKERSDVRQEAIAMEPSHLLELRAREPDERRHRSYPYAGK